MRLMNAFKYQMTTALKSLGLFYGIILALSLITQLLVHVVIKNDAAGLAALEGSTGMFMMFLGVFSIVEDFKFFLQNGYSRRSMIKLYVLQFVACALTAAIADTIIGWILESSNSAYMSLFTQLYGSQAVLLRVIWLFVLYLCISLLSFFITVLFQRFSKRQRIMFMAVLPCAVMILIPVFDVYMLDGRTMALLVEGLTKLMGLGSQINLMMPFMTFGVLSVVFSLLSYVAIRRVAMFVA